LHIQQKAPGGHGKQPPEALLKNPSLHVHFSADFSPLRHISFTCEMLTLTTLQAVAVESQLLHFKAPVAF
jgi:hypothetical protein